MWIDVAYVLPIELAADTLWSPIRKPLLSYFAAEDIAWHEEGATDYGARDLPGPSPNLMDSQIACLNFWWGLAHAGPDSLLSVVQQLVPEAVTVVPPRDHPGAVLLEPEWIGLENYLGERGKKRRRGAYATSADLLVVYEDDPGRRHGILLESKFSETYSGKSLRYSKRGTDRAAVYRPAWSATTCPIRADAGVDLGDVMFDPFDQLMRLQLLAAAMETAHELRMESVRVAWVAPSANLELWERITAPALVARGTRVPEVWRGLLRDPDRFLFASYEALFEAASSRPGAAEWVGWQRERYGWERGCGTEAL